MHYQLRVGPPQMETCLHSDVPDADAWLITHFAKVPLNRLSRFVFSAEWTIIVVKYDC